MTELRAHLREYIKKARAGEQVVITDRGVPAARLVSADKDDEEALLIDRLTRAGVLAPPASRGPKRQATREGLSRATVSVSDLVSEMRR